MHFNDVFSVSFREAGGKLVHTFCFLSFLRHSADPHQIVPNCNTQAIFPVTIFAYFRIFKRLFLHISTASGPCAPPHTWLSFCCILPHCWLFLSSAHMSIIRVPICVICVSFEISAVSLSDLTQSLPIKPAGKKNDLWVHTHTQIFQSEWAQRRASEQLTFML